MDKVSHVLSKNKAATQAQVILLLNPILRGWAMYHRHVVAAATFSRIDHLVWAKLWRWAKRRHPQKGVRWIKARYFQRQGLKDWVCPSSGTEPTRQFMLWQASTLPIKRHTKIRGNANPFDPAWSDYFHRRSNAR